MAISQQSPPIITDSFIRYAEEMGGSELHFRLDPKTQLHAIVAIHSTHRGPALGGCRCLEYDHLEDALFDVLRLSRGMSYKAAMANLPLGGGKSVLLKPKHITDRNSYFETFGKFVDDLGGRYITAVDSGTDVADMDAIATQTSYVTCNSQAGDIIADPSAFTAEGVRRGIQAAVKFKLQRDSLEGVHVAIEGLGHVGYHLAKELHQLGAKLSVYDINASAVARCVAEFNATAVQDIYQVACDVYAPCALGASLNSENIHKLKMPIIAGSANNQLATEADGIALHEKGILYAPDYVINAGGLIHVYAQYERSFIDASYQKIEQIYDTLLSIFERAQHAHKPTSEIADFIAASKI